MEQFACCEFILTTTRHEVYCLLLLFHTIGVCRMRLLTARARGKILLAAVVRGHSRAVSSSCVVLLASSPSEQLQSKEVEGHAHSSLDPQVPPLLVPTSATGRSPGQVTSDGSNEVEQNLDLLAFFNVISR